MSKTKQILAITISLIVGVILVVLATLGVQSLLHKDNTPPPPPVPVVEAPPATPMAQIISVKPHIITETTSIDKCHQVPHTSYVQQQVAVKSNGSPVGGTLLGGALGGLAGSAIHGDARNAAILAGAGLGAYAGHEMQSQSYTPVYKMIPKTTYHTKCGKQTVTKKIESGFEVTYWYNGNQGTVIMPAPPASNTLPLQSLTNQYEEPANTAGTSPTITSSN